MSTRIQQLSDRKISVNGKIVYCDTNGKWTTTEELTTAEARAFRLHMHALGISLTED